MTLERGALLQNRYRILEILGEGGMGAVYKALDESLAVTVAVKENLFSSEEYSRQFRIEAQILATLRHPNLTRVTDHFEVNEIQYIVMDFIEGEDLRDRMDRFGILDESQVIKIGIGICDALTYLHHLQPPILHRDIKPGNVRIAPNGQVFLVDFGLAKIVKGNQMTVTGARAMTPGYSPPEQYGTARTDERSDIYSLGASLYSAVTAALPEDGLARAMKQVKLTPLRDLNPKISRRFANIITRSLEVQPEDRYQSAAELRKALVNALSITRRRPDPEELMVKPPPEEISTPGLRKRSLLGEELLQRESVASESEDINAILEASKNPGRSPKKSRKTFVKAMLWSVLGFTLLSGLISINYFYPDAPQRVLSLLQSATPTPAKASEPVAAISTLTELSLNATDQSSATPTAVATDTPVPTYTSTSLPTDTPFPTTTPTLTEIPPPTATPLGGSARIAFASDRSGSPQIWLMDLDGSNVLQLTNISGGACQPDWSPDGMQLVFISPCLGEQEEYLESSLFTIHVDGTNLEPVPGSVVGDYDPDWSPDGSLLVFTSVRDTSTQVFLISLEDGSFQPLTSEGLKNLQPTWNANGTKISFVSARAGPFQVWVMNPDGSEQGRFSRSGDLKDSSPIWTKDNRHMIFVQRAVPNGTPAIIMAPVEEDGFSEVRLTISAFPARSPSLSADGNWLVYESWPDGNNHDLYLMNLINLDTARLTLNAAFDFDPAWRPIP